MKFMFSISIFALVLCAYPVTQAAEPIALFDGTTLDGWDGDANLWRVEDGCITGETSEENKLAYNKFLIWRKGTVSDFEIEFDYRILSDWANSGLQYRSKDMSDHVVSGYQADIDSELKFTGISYGEKTSRGIMAERGKRVWLGDAKTKNKTEVFADSKVLQASIKGKGEWNHYKVTANGTTMTHYINGVLMSETIDESKQDAVMDGILALQLHKGQPMKVQFKNIMLTQLK